MAGNPSETPSSGRSELGPSAEQAAQRQPGERYGPLLLERLRKDDGRALILYMRAEEGA